MTVNAMAEQLLSLQVAMAGPVPETEHLLRLHLAANTAMQDDGVLAVIDENGNPRLSMAPGFPAMTIPDLLAETRVAMPVLFGPTQAETTAAAVKAAKVADVPVDDSLAARIRRDSADHAAHQIVVTAERQAAMIRQAEAAAEAARAPAVVVNPFDPRTHNLTAQMFMLNTDPALARQMKAALLPAWNK